MGSSTGRCLPKPECHTPHEIAEAHRSRTEHIIDGVAGRQIPGKKSGKKDKYGKSHAVITNPEEFAKRVIELEAVMYTHAENLEFEDAARIRDQVEELRAGYLASAPSI